MDERPFRGDLARRLLSAMIALGCGVVALLIAILLIRGVLA